MNWFEFRQPTVFLRPGEIRTYAELWGIHTDHFDLRAVRLANLRSTQRPLSEVLAESSTYPRKDVKRGLLRKWARFYENEAERHELEGG